MPAGRPTTYRPEYCKTVIELGKQGKSVAQMCAHFDIARSTIDQWAVDNPEFSEAFTRAKTHMQAVLEAMAFDGLSNREFNAPLWKTTMQARFREDYTERREVAQETKVEITGAPGKVDALLKSLAPDGEE